MKQEWHLETVVYARVVAPFTLDLVFSDGKRKRLNLRDRLRGPIFKPLRDPRYFALVQVDSTAGTVVWPNGADFAPETLYELEESDTGAKAADR